MVFLVESKETKYIPDESWEVFMVCNFAEILLLE